MIRKITEFVHRICKLRFLIVLAAAFIIVEVFFTVSMPVFQELTGGTLLDMSLGYSAEEAYQRLQTFHKADALYFRIRAVDFFFPLIYALLLSLTSCFIYKKKYSDADSYRWILFVPFTAAGFDYIENIMLVVMYRLLPEEFSAAAVVLNVVTILKFLLLGLSLLLIVTGGIYFIKGNDSGLSGKNSFRGGKE